MGCLNKMRLYFLIWVFALGFQVVHGGSNIKTPRTATPHLPSPTYTVLPTPPDLSPTTISIPTVSADNVKQQAPSITPPASLLLDANGEVQVPSMQVKWHLTTYYTCLQRGAVTACGWHEPVLPGGDEIAAAPGRLSGESVARLGGMGLFWGAVGVLGIW